MQIGRLNPSQHLFSVQPPNVLAYNSYALELQVLEDTPFEL